MMERLKSELARVLDTVDEDISPDTNLIEIGLHSLAIMRLLEPLAQIAGARLDYADLARQPTLGAWQAHIERLQADAGS